MLTMTASGASKPKEKVGHTSAGINLDGNGKPSPDPAAKHDDCITVVFFFGIVVIYER